MDTELLGQGFWLSLGTLIMLATQICYLEDKELMPKVERHYGIPCRVIRKELNALASEMKKNGNKKNTDLNDDVVSLLPILKQHAPSIVNSFLNKKN